MRAIPWVCRDHAAAPRCRVLRPPARAATPARRVMDKSGVTRRSICSVSVWSRQASICRPARCWSTTSEATLLRDVLSVKLDSSGLYGGRVSGELMVDRKKDDPSLGLQLRFSGIDALPFLQDVASSTDVRFTGPLMLTAAGAAGLRTRTLDFRADPRLVASAGTPGEAPRGIGVPVLIQGPWSAPRIYADTPNNCAPSATRWAADVARVRRPTRRSASLSRAFPRDLASPTGKRRVTVAGSRRTVEGARRGARRRGAAIRTDRSRSRCGAAKIQTAA
jgi:hypothetical protein